MRTDDELICVREFWREGKQILHEGTAYICKDVAPSLVSLKGVEGWFQSSRFRKYDPQESYHFHKYPLDYQI